MLEDFDIYSLAFFLVSGFAVQCIVLRKHIFGVFDPLLYFIVSSAFAITLSALVLDNAPVFWRVTFNFTFFWVGFLLTCTRTRHPLPCRTLKVSDADFFERLVFVGVVLMVLFNAIGWFYRGIPLLSASPSIDKVDGLTGGLGFIRRLNWGAGVFVLIGSLYWFLARRNIGAFAAFAIASLVTALGGSKSSLLPLLFAAGLYTTRPFTSNEITDISSRLRYAFPVIALLAIVPVLTVFTIESEDLQQALTSLIIRLLYFGDVMLYWGQQNVRSAFSAIGPLDYPGHLFNGVTGFLRLSGYDTPLGTQMVNTTLGSLAELDSAIGPNTPFYVKGELFFGPYGAPFYAFNVGMLFKWIRSQFFQYAGESLTRYTVLATLVVLSGALPVEDSLFVVQFFDFAIFFALIYLTARIVDLALPRRKNSGNIKNLRHARS